jgi:hypothetical protein
MPHFQSQGASDHFASFNVLRLTWLLVSDLKNSQSEKESMPHFQFQGPFSYIQFLTRCDVSKTDLVRVVGLRLGLKENADDSRTC